MDGRFISRFTMRDLLWFFVVVGVTLAWAASHKAQSEAWWKFHDQKYRSWKERHDQMKQECDRDLEQVNSKARELLQENLQLRQQIRGATQ
jgi:hypothetical protein